MNRLLAFLAAIAGFATIVAGIGIMFLALLASESSKGMAEGLGMIAAGSGLMAGSEALKNTGKYLENGK